jgi:hypothetical protein
MPISKKALQEYADENQALAAYRRAEAALYENAAKEAAAGITHETPEYQRLNQAVIDAGKQLPKRFKHLTKEG